MKNWLGIAEQQMDIARARGEDTAGTAAAVEAILMHLKEEQKPRDVKFELATKPSDIVPGVKDIADKLAKAQKMQFVINDLGSWASAAQDDPGCCSELKVIFLRLLELCDYPEDFCRGCGADIPPRIGEGTCPKCDPGGCALHAKRLKYAVHGNHHVHPGPVPDEMKINQVGCWTSVNPYAEVREPEAWPAHWPSYYNIGEPCDMRVGHCACGAYHDVGEFTLEKNSMGNLYIKREFKKWPGDHVGDGYNSACNCCQCKSIRTNAAMCDR